MTRIPMTRIPMTHIPMTHTPMAHIPMTGIPVARTRVTHLLHVCQSFAAGGAQVRTAAIINHLGPSFRHTLVALDGRFDAAERIDHAITVNCLPAHAYRSPLRAVAMFMDLFRHERPALILTYNWGSMDAALAAGLRGDCPLIHTEDGFGADEVARQKLRRILFRRVALRSASHVIAPSRTLWNLMRDCWRLPEAKLRYIPNGIDTQHFTPASARAAGQEIIVGSIGHLRPEKRYEVLIEACAALNRNTPARLLLAGDGVERERLERVARGFGFEDRVTFLGNQKDVRGVYGRLDIFAMSSGTEQMPLAVLEAMASGLPVASTDVGDVRDMVSAGNRPYVCAAEGLAGALEKLAHDACLRRSLGTANRDRAQSAYDLRAMGAAYESLYRSVLA